MCAGVIGSIHYQGTCGSCWASASTYALESRICIGTNLAFRAMLSLTMVASCSETNGCAGGFSSYAFDLARTQGVPAGCLPGCVLYLFRHCLLENAVMILIRSIQDERIISATLASLLYKQLQQVNSLPDSVFFRDQEEAYHCLYIDVGLTLDQRLQPLLNV